MDNLATDTNVGTNFQPMPKRFMVWDTVDERFIIIHSKSKIGSLEDIVHEFKDNPKIMQQCVIVQSTNLFNKDGEEILEGHIVGVGGETGTVRMVRGEWHAVGDDDVRLSVWKSSGIEILGHILSNPELLEENYV